MSPVQRANEMSPSTSVSSTSSRSTLLPNNPSRSTSKSTATNTEQSERPNRSWNAIVYEILATSDGPLTFPQLVQSIKNRYPFFNSSSQDKVLKSGPKNPLYFHEAFCRDEVVNGKQAWALKPGEFLDKKTGEVLTPQPRYTVSSPRNTQQTYEAEDWTPGDSTLRSSHSFNPGSSIPRFGREILNSPEIPDSQDAGVITPSPQEKDSRIVTEQSPHLEHAYQQTPPIVRNIANEVTDAAESAFAAVSNGASPSGRSPQSHLQRATTNGSSTSTTPYGQSPVAAGAKSQSILQRVDTVDYKPSGTGSHSPTAFQASQPFGSSTTTSSSPSIISSTGENGNGSNSITTQPASTSTPPVHAVSPTQVTTSLEGRAAISELPAFTPAAAKPSVTTLPSMLLYVALFILSLTMYACF